MKLHVRSQSFFFLFSFYCYIGSSYAITVPPTNHTIPTNGEPSILLSIKSSLVDPLSRLHDWKNDPPSTSNSSAAPPHHCTWTGVSCNAEGVVEALDLSHMNLSGTVSDDFQHLKTLTSLNLCCNNFSSSLPKSITNLVSLSSIDLSQNGFVGDFPLGFGSVPGLKYLNASGNNFSSDLPGDLGNATLLETLDVRGNFFQGSIHGSYRVLQKLKFLGLSGNNLSGLVPPELGELPALDTMILGYNFFGGGIPAELGNLTNLKYLDIAIANLSGEIPPELGKLKKLDTMFLYQNNLEGRIPSTIGNLTSVVNFDVSFNLLSGELPDEISEMKNLQLLNLMGNRLSGSVPTGLALLPQLQVLALWNNSFTGSLPSDLGENSASLSWLDVSSNAFSGVIPSGLCHGGNLTKLILFNNALSGPIPTSLTKCQSLFRVRMQNNQLSGTIPVGLGKLPKLQRLELGNNRLTGKIPDDLSSSPSLSFIDLSRNNLQSPLPANILYIPTLQAFIASGNDLGGTIPNQFQDCPSLSVLDLGSNHFTGTVPSSIASCQKLVTLVLRINELNGEIPESLAMMQSLAIIDLSNNSLTGTIPQHLGTSPALETLNVSYNNLSGPVPTNGILRTINPNDLKGNSGLCGGILPPCSKDSLSLSGHGAGVHTKHILTGWLIGISTVLAVVVAAIGAHSLYSRYYANGSCFEERFYDTRRGDWPWRLMAFQRLGFTTGDILSCVKESNVIGKGASGIVYRAEIPRSNTVVAVKKLWTPSSSDIEAGNNGGDHDELAGEVNLLGKLRHRNIVRLLGFLHNNKEVMVVYEYMQNGNLGDALHGKQRLLLVDWVSRYNIALGVAHGLAYLHHDCHPPVIHRDVKSNNILLDGNLEARVADFGLAKMMIGKNETVSMVAGSYGYIAPEYGYTLKVDQKSDIYSYGVVLLELLTGKRPLDLKFGDSSTDIVEWIRCKMRNKRPLEEVLDENIGGGNCKHVREEMLLVLQIALLCTAKLPKDRPSMRDVITMLGEAKPRRKSSSINNGGILSDKDKPVFSPSPVI